MLPATIYTAQGADDIPPMADSIQPEGLMPYSRVARDSIQGLRLDAIPLCGFHTAQSADSIHGCAVMHTVFNGILRYSACTTDE